MKVEEFLNTKRVSQRERDICIRVYGSKDLDAKAWEKKLSTEVTFLPETEPVAEVKEEVKTETPTDKVDNTSDVEVVQKIEPNKKNK